MRVLKTFVIIESPYAGDVERNLRYARMAVKDCLRRGEVPYASHLFFTQMLDDLNPAERKQGIEAGLQIAMRADLTVVYTDLGITPGMDQGIKDATAASRPVELRRLGEDWERG